MSEFSFLLDQLRATGFRFPEYITFATKTADQKETGEIAPSYHPTDLETGSRENVWLSSVKLAAMPLRPLQREFLHKKIADAAFRYGIESDLEKVSEAIQNFRQKTAGIETVTDYEIARDWFFKNAGYMEGELRTRLADHLLEQAKKLGHVPSLLEKVQINEAAGRDPVTDEVRQFAEQNLHKLANGSVYRTDQFGCLTPETVREYLPHLLREASLGMNVIEPHRFGKVASLLPEHEATVLDALLGAQGEFPVHREKNLPVEIGDDVLAAL